MRKIKKEVLTVPSICITVSIIGCSIVISVCRISITAPSIVLILLLISFTIWFVGTLIITRFVGTLIVTRSLISS